MRLLVKFIIFIACLALAFVVLILSFYFYEVHKDRKTDVVTTGKKIFSHTTFPMCKNKLMTILSIDGGGSRGIVPLYFLSKIESHTHQSIRENFDIMSGVSVGGLLVAALSIKNKNGSFLYSAKQLIQMYQHFSDSLLKVSFHRNILSVNGFVSPKFSSYDKFEFLKKYIPMNLYLDDLSGNTIFFGTNAVNNALLTFCSWKNCFKPLQKYPLYTLISGITSPFGYFSPQFFLKNDHKISYILGDATYIIKDPTLQTYIISKNLCPNEKHYLLLSLGTGETPEHDLKTNAIFHWGTIKWIFHVFANMYYGGQDVTKQELDMVSRSEKNAVIYIRINPKIPKKAYSPFVSTPSDMRVLLSASNQYYLHHQAMFKCLFETLKTHRLKKNCEHILVSNPNTV